MSKVPTYFDLRGKTAFITGGSAGIGAESARWLAQNRVKIALSGRNEARLSEIVNELIGMGAEALCVPADCTNAQDLAAARIRAEATLGPIDILTAFAGGGTARPAPVEQTSEEDWRSAIDHNLTATFLTIKAILPGTKARQRGAIITMASTAGRAPSQASPAYAPAKAGIIILTQHLAQEVGPAGIRVNCISPSAV
jgi:3-oxoacyl-[acyl-carrier protein] reductase